MDLHLVIVEREPDTDPESLYLGLDASAAAQAYSAQKEGRISHFRLHNGQAFESIDFSVRHLVHRTEPKPDDAPKPPVAAADLPGPKPGEIVHDAGTGKDFVRTAADPHQLNPLPEDPDEREKAIREACGHRDRQLATEVAPPNPELARRIDEEREAHEQQDQKAIDDAINPAVSVGKPVSARKK